MSKPPVRGLLSSCLLSQTAKEALSATISLCLLVQGSASVAFAAPMQEGGEPSVLPDPNGSLPGDLPPLPGEAAELAGGAPGSRKLEWAPVMGTKQMNENWAHLPVSVKLPNQHHLRGRSGSGPQCEDSKLQETEIILMRDSAAMAIQEDTLRQTLADAHRVLADAEKYASTTRSLWAVAIGAATAAATAVAAPTLAAAWAARSLGMAGLEATKVALSAELAKSATMASLFKAGSSGYGAFGTAKKIMSKMSKRVAETYSTGIFNILPNQLSGYWHREFMKDLVSSAALNQGTPDPSWYDKVKQEINAKARRGFVRWHDRVSRRTDELLKQKGYINNKGQETPDWAYNLKNIIHAGGYDRDYVAILTDDAEARFKLFQANALYSNAALADLRSTCSMLAAVKLGAQRGVGRGAKAVAPAREIPRPAVYEPASGNKVPVNEERDPEDLPKAQPKPKSDDSSAPTS